MYELFLTLHVLSAAAIGFYLIFPLLVLSLRHSEGKGQAGISHLLFSLNRFGQYILIITFVTGGYMVSKAGVSVPWMIASVVLILVIFAMTGMMAKPLKRVRDAAAEGNKAEEALAKVQTFGWIVMLALLLILILMVNRQFI